MSLSSEAEISSNMTQDTPVQPIEASNPISDQKVAADTSVLLADNLTPKAIVAELDRYIVGQDAAKRAVAVALRNRWRRLRTPDHLQSEIMPKNITMIGPTGCGKTEIARRMAKITNAPFIKVEASKFTEVGYVGRDVETIIRDLTEVGVVMERNRQMLLVQAQAKLAAEERVLQILVPSVHTSEANGSSETRERFRAMLHAGELNDKTIEVEVEERTQHSIVEMVAFPAGNSPGSDGMDNGMKDFFSQFMPKRSKNRKMTVEQAMQVLTQEEAEQSIDQDDVVRDAILHVEQNGIVFLDEIDKVAGRSYGNNPDISREGVQRDLLPILEGSAVQTKHGQVHTDHILFIAAGAFHVAKPADLIPEFQGRFPIRVELKALKKGDFVRILTEPKNALINQYQALLGAEEVTLQFTTEGIETLADIAAEVNQRDENIGARRLHTILEKTLEEVSFEAPDLKGQTIPITPEYIHLRLKEVLQNKDLRQHML